MEEMKDNQNRNLILLNSKKCLDILNIKAKPIKYLKGDQENLDNIQFFHNLSQTVSIKSNQLFTTTTTSSNVLKKGVSKRKLSRSINEDIEKENDSHNSLNKDNDSSNGEEEISTTIRAPKTEQKRAPYKRKRSMSVELFLGDYIKGIKSEEKLPDSPYIYSFSKFHPFSYLLGHLKGFIDKKGKLHHPSPTLIDSATWMKKPGLTKNDILYGMEISPENGLVLVDKEVTKRFKGIIKELLKQFIKATFTGQKFSLSVRLFEPKSFLQSISEYWFYLPNFLPKAANPSLTPMERFEIIMAFAISGLYIPSKKLKAFNPLIGETFQGEINHPEGKIQVYLEQIANYPNASRFYIKHKNFIMHGYFDISMKNESFGNKITIIIKGFACVEFKEIGEKIYFLMPYVRVLNGASDNRSTFFTSCMVFSDIKNNLKGVIQLGKNKKDVNAFEGLIIRYQFDKNYIFNPEVEREFGNKVKMDNSDKKHKLDIRARIHGSWLKNFVSNDKVYWDIDRDTPDWIKPVKNCLPSDGRFREDIIWLYRSFFSYKNEKERETYEELSQDWKLMLEKLQREEREIKKKASKKKK